METKDRFYTCSNLRRYLKTVLKRVGQGEEIVITVWGKPVASITRYKEGKEK